MTIMWISLSTRWGLSSVQAALNVIISVLSTVGIWALSRYWWQQGSAKILRENSNVPLSTLWNLSGAGEGFDVITVLRKGIFAKENWRLLFQLVVVIAVTLTSMLSGPIAQVSLRTSRTVQLSKLEVVQSTKGAGAGGNILQADVLWNATIQSFNEAGFPNKQLLDYLPPSTAPWTYVPSEWNPTWSMACDYTAETVLHNVTATGNSTFYDPINAFPVYRDTYDQSWLNGSEYRVQADFTSWANYSNPVPFTDVLFFILIQSDPAKDDQMHKNNGTLRMSVSALHARSFAIRGGEDATEAGATRWVPIGSVGNASFTRVECNITRKAEVPDPNAIPWVWTNDTYSITQSYEMYWTNPLEEDDARNTIISTPTAEDLLRFYQAYMATMSTIHSSPTLRDVSVWMDTVQLSIAFLVTVVVLTCLTLWVTGRYFWFLRRNKSQLEQAFVPDSKVEWMIHAAKTAQAEDEEVVEGKKPKDREYLYTATFGYNGAGLNGLDGEERRPSLARVYNTRNSMSEASRSNNRGSLSKNTSQIRLPSPASLKAKPERHDVKGINARPTSVDPHSAPELVVSLANNNTENCSQEYGLHPGEKMLTPQISEKVPPEGSQSSSISVTNSLTASFRSIVLERGDSSFTIGPAKNFDGQR